MHDSSKVVETVVFFALGSKDRVKINFDTILTQPYKTGLLKSGLHPFINY